MVRADSLAAYKNKPAIVKDQANGKISISLEDGSLLKVRDKDIELIYQNPVKDLKEIKNGDIPAKTIHEIWELLLSEQEPVSLKALCELFGEYSASTAWSAYCLLNDGLYFTGTIDAVTPRGREEVTAGENKRNEREKETEERLSFLERLKACIKAPAVNSLFPDDARFLQDVEALAFGKTAKSRTMKEMALGETPEDAHALLLKTGLWTTMINPHPLRFGVSLNSAAACIEKPPAENRRDLTHLTAFAIDNPFSNDPDDAVSIEKDEEGNNILYVHIADPASSIAFDSPAEREARDRGATLYLPENTFRMLAEEAIPLFALGLSGTSPALTFKMTLDRNVKILHTDIFPSVVKVMRMTYAQADKEMSDEIAETSAMLRALFELAQNCYNLRMLNGAVNIEMPEVHITAINGTVNIEPVLSYNSTFTVRECMLLAGIGAGNWAAHNDLSFPYIVQEAENIDKVPAGIAGSYQLRRCMRSRIIQTKPGFHQGLGLDGYTQVTSPLRRYTDLLAHLQIRAFLRGEKTLDSDEVLERVSAGEAAAAAAARAERASRNHWTCVYLSDKKDSVFEAAALEKKGNRWAVIIPSLALETQVLFQKELSPNENVRLILMSVNIPRSEAVFAPVAVY